MTNPLLKPRIRSLIFCFAALIGTVNAQTNCENTSTLAEGYATSISDVVDNGNGSYTITLIVVNDGCSGCKKLNSFTVEADPGTYSNVIVQVLSGAVTYASISMGPNLSGTSVTGFRINNTNGIGNGDAAAFSVTYTLTGALQDQQTLCKAGPNQLVSAFSASDFQAVLSCLNGQGGSIFPYFDPYANKIYDLIGVELTSLYYTYLGYRYLHLGRYLPDPGHQCADLHPDQAG